LLQPRLFRVPATPDEAPQPTSTLVRHRKRPEWGAAICAWIRQERQAYQFEDGKLRVFKQGWYDRIEEIDLPLNKAATTAARLNRKRGLTALHKMASTFDGISFEDQLRLLGHFYPGGFSGEKWQKEKRGAEQKRRLKRHRDAAVAHAREALSADAIDKMIADEDYDAAWDTIVDVLKSTDLVNTRQMKTLTMLEPDKRETMVKRTRQLLWSDEPYKIRLERFIGALALATGKEPSWQLATALPALVHPKEHICVRPTSMKAQASWMAPRLKWSKVPSAPLYMRLHDMVITVREELTEGDYEPTDMLDIYDFMWTTLRPKAREALKSIKAEMKEVA
jgi:hypothetical protein